MQSNVLVTDNLFEIVMFVFEKNPDRVKNYENVKNKIPYLLKLSSIDSINNFNNAVKINNKFNFNTNKIIYDKLKGKLGCNLSQQRLWHNHLKNGKKNWILILEDDTNVSFDNITIFNNTLNSIINYADKNCSHFIQLEVRNHHLPGQLQQQKTSIPNLYKMKSQCGMSAYLINKKAIKYFFDFLPWDLYIDLYTNIEPHLTNLKSLCYVNPFFKTLGAQREVDRSSELGSIIYNYKSNKKNDFR